MRRASRLMGGASGRAPSATSALRIAVVIVSVAIAVLGLTAACGGDMMDNSMHAQMRGGGSQAPQTPVVSDASEVTVEIVNFDFLPRDLTVDGGSTVIWVNADAVPHDATDEAGDWGTGTLAPGESARLLFDAPGAYEYLCTIHPNMTATLKVV